MLRYTEVGLGAVERQSDFHTRTDEHAIVSQMQEGDEWQMPSAACLS
jgi:hypothetical protein